MLRPEDRLVEEAVAELERRPPEDPEQASVGPIVEDAVQALPAPSGGVIREDGTVRVAIIRPCISRGRKIRAPSGDLLPPIYTPRMLAENAGIFSGWHMFMDHLTEQMVETLRRRNRSIRELGGRITRSWYDPQLVTEEDEVRGFERGGVVGNAIPQPPIRAMLEADPDILRVSINAFPTGARPGVHRGRPGMLIEGISSEPPGSVDWVLRAGAGGRVLREDEDLAVSLLEGFYDPRHREEETVKPDFSKMTTEQIREWLQENQPEVYARLTGEPSVTVTTPPVTEAEEYITATDAELLLTETARSVEERVTQRLQEHAEEVERRADERIRLREEQHRLRDHAHELIRNADGLTPGWRAALTEEYAVLPSGPTPTLLLEDTDERSALQILEDQVEARVKQALQLIAETRTGPVVEEQGGAPEGSSAPKKKPRDNAFRIWLAEQAGLGSAEDQEKALQEAVSV